ncbi:MAG: DNA-binding response regulator, partial [Chloroflexi bacterium]
MRVLLVDDHPLFREGLASVLQSQPDFDVVGEAGSVCEAVEMARALQPDVVVMDFCLPDGSGADASRVILSERPRTKIVFLTVHDDDDCLFAAISGGAHGYLLKNAGAKELVASLRALK